MPPRPSDRALRSLVARLASRRPEDIRAILDDLEPSQRRQIDQLLADYAGAPVRRSGVPDPEPAAAIIPDGLSSWLVARLKTTPHQTHGPDGTGDAVLHLGDSFSMTGPAVQALKAAAARMQPAVEAPMTQRSSGLWSLLDDLWRGRTSWRGSS